MPDEDIERTEGIVPMTERLLELRGTPDEPVHNLCFEDLTFADATWLKPSETGLIDLQANFTMGPQTLLFARLIPGNDRNHSCLVPYHCECTKSPASVVCHAAANIHFERCSFIRLGGAGLDIECGAHDNLVSYCTFSDIAGSGVQVGDVKHEDHHPGNPNLVVRNNIIRDCLFQRVAQDYKGGVGVFAGYTNGTTIEHCEFYDLPYSAISVGWGWGELDAGGGGYVHPDQFDTPTSSANNRIENNHIYNVMMELNDGGAIYTLGEMPGTVIQGNHIHDSHGAPGGIYLDEGSGHIEVSSNVVYRTARPLNFNNLVQNRRATCTVHDNHIDGPDAADFPRDIVERAGPRPIKQDNK